MRSIGFSRKWKLYKWPLINPQFSRKDQVVTVIDNPSVLSSCLQSKESVNNNIYFKRTSLGFTSTLSINFCSFASHFHCLHFYVLTMSPWLGCCWSSLAQTNLFNALYPESPRKHEIHIHCLRILLLGPVYSHSTSQYYQYLYFAEAGPGHCSLRAL